MPWLLKRVGLLSHVDDEPVQPAGPDPALGSLPERLPDCHEHGLSVQAGPATVTLPEPTPDCHAVVDEEPHAAPGDEIGEGPTSITDNATVP